MPNLLSSAGNIKSCQLMRLGLEIKGIQVGFVADLDEYGPHPSVEPIFGLFQEGDVLKRVSFENRTTIYRGELDERSESKKRRVCSLSLSHSLFFSTPNGQKLQPSGDRDRNIRWSVKWKH